MLGVDWANFSLLTVCRPGEAYACIDLVTCDVIHVLLVCLPRATY